MQKRGRTRQRKKGRRSKNGKDAREGALTLLVTKISVTREREFLREREGEEKRDEKRRRAIRIDKREGRQGENARDRKISIAHMRGKGEEESREDQNFEGRRRYHGREREVKGEEEIFLLLLLSLMRAHTRMERSDNMQS